MPPFSRRDLSARAYMVLLAIALLGPVLLFSGALLVRFARSEHDRYREHAIEAAQRGASALDRDIAGVVVALRTLATSSQIDSGNMERFRERALQVAPMLDAPIVLRNPHSQQLVNTALPPGAALPAGQIPLVDARVVATAQPYISDLLVSKVSGQPMISVTVPVMRGGRVIALLSAGMQPLHFADLIRAQHLPADWTMTLLDRTGSVIAAAGAEPRPVSQAIESGLRLHLTGPTGVWTERDDAGASLVAAHALTAFTEGQVIVEAPITGMQAPLRESFRLFAAFGVAAMAASVLIGLRLGALISGPLGRLAASGGKFGRGDPIMAVPTPIREIRTLSEVLQAASAELLERGQERDEVEGKLRELAATLESRVDQRTRELSDANRALIGEMGVREAAEAQVRQMQKMEAVGQLTGGIAHDFNNMLAAIISALTLIRRRLARGESDVGGIVDAAIDSAMRAGNLTRRLLAFSRQQPLAPEPVDANRMVAGMQELLQRTLGEGVRLETVLAPQLWHTHADPSQLENAILNLAVNARDAMPEGGNLAIETANCRPNPGDGDAMVPYGDHVMIAVRDTGTGMPADVVARAFDPFFTTKAVGRGTGLGLSQVYGFVRQSGGNVDIQSESGRGTMVRIFLPRFEGSAEPGIRALPPRPIAHARTGERVLLVDDEERVRQMSALSLRELGYTVVVAENGLDALRQLDTDPRIALLFTDIVMPDVNGRKLAEAARQRRPDLKVLFTTGFNRDLPEPGTDTLPKPFTLEQLAAKVRDALDSPA